MKLSPQHECLWRCWRLKADFCMVAGCRRMHLCKSTYTCCNQIQTPNASSPSYFVLSLLWHPFPFKSQHNPGNWCYYCFLSQRFPLKRLFLKGLWRLMQSSNLSLAISSSPVTSPACSSWEGLCVLHQPCTDSAAHGPPVSHNRWALGFSWGSCAWSC